MTTHPIRSTPLLNPPKHPLENRIPPPFVTLGLGILMGAIARVTPHFADILPGQGWLAGGVALAGMSCLLGGVRAFSRSSTTIDPVHLDRASTLVTGGIFRFTRNPMYVGFTLLLAGWAVFLAAPVTWLGPLVFLLVTQRFQIEPEERTMRAKFGAAYDEYCRRVRRWI